MKILNERQIRQKIQRLAIEILERNLEEEVIIFAGINNKGMAFAQLLIDNLQAITGKTLLLTNVRLNPANPLSEPITIGLPLKDLHNQVIIVVDDVANTGRTLFYACKPLLDALPKRLEVAVLVDRKHKSFPIQPDYLGLSLATTLKENIEVNIKNGEEQAVFLD